MKKPFLASILSLLMVTVCIVALTACNVTIVCPHSWGEWATTSNATCIQEGVQKRTCSLCGMTETQTIEMTDHIPQPINDCTQPVLCATCGEVLAEANESHIGGTATCAERAKCDVCGMEYGELAEHILDADDGDCTTAVCCSVCKEILIEATEGHVGGMATCTEKAKCDVCAMEYGELAEHILDADDGDCTTATYCMLCKEILIPANQNHIGGIPTCKYQAVCEVCGMEYGELAEHIPEADDGDCTTAIYCLICNDPLIPANQNHIGGMATCYNKAQCDVCGMEYGNVAEHIPEPDDGDCTTAVHCVLCYDILVEANATHIGGMATCTQKAMCTVCDKEYGDLVDHNPWPDDGDCTTEVCCILCNAILVEANATHTGGTATCTQKAVCSVCGMEYGNVAGHNPEPDDGDCTTAVLCLLCREILVEANATHIGGTATCEHKAVCDACGMEYGELAEHTGETVWVKHLNSHYLVYSCCYEQVSEAEDHTKVDGSCTVCGFNPTITITSPEITQGETQVQVAFSISDNPGITGLTAKVQYSSDVFELTQATNGDAFGTLTFTTPGALNSGCTFMWDATNIADKDVKDGEFLILTFNVSENAPIGEYSILLTIKAYDNDLNPISLLITGGKITIKNT